MVMSLLPYHIHDEINKLIKTLRLEVFDMDKYVYDDFQENYNYLQTLDSKEWKEQDHYAVLGLKKIRFNASQELLRKAHRRQVLNHHPDKGKLRSHDAPRKSGDDNSDYFCCITTAYNLLSDESRRRSYDSIDPEFDDSLPESSEVRNDFYHILGPVFELNSRWSKKQPVPQLGFDDDKIDNVLNFYKFWDNFESWREWSYVMEGEEAENRQERRFLDKQKKSEKKKKRDEEGKRIRKLVEMARKYDPRLKRETERWKQQKEEQKREREERKLKKIQELEEAKRKEEERLEMEEAERKRIQQQESDALKKEKEVQKNRLKSERKQLRKFVEGRKYFEDCLMKEESNKSIKLRTAEILNSVDLLCQKLTCEELNSLNKSLQLNQSNDEETLQLIRKEVDRANSDKTVPCNTAKNGVTKTIEERPEAKGSNNKCGDRAWDFELTQLLIRAINTHGPGTKQRWHMVAEFMNTHIPGLCVKEKQIIQKAKSLKSDDTQLKKEAASQGLITKDVTSVTDKMQKVDITDRSEAITEALPWTAEEQRRLEKALKSIPASESCRWEKISEVVQTRTRKECVLRFKELSEKLKAKKAAATKS